MNAKHTIVIDGRTITRKSHRTYTHVVIGRWPREHDVRGQTGDEAKRNFLSDGNFGYYANGGWRKYAASLPADQNAKFEALEAEYKAVGPEAAWKKEVEERIARIDNREACGHYQMTAITWSQSLANANKAAASARNRGNVDVSVVECVRVPVVARKSAEAEEILAHDPDAGDRADAQEAELNARLKGRQS